MIARTPGRDARLFHGLGLVAAFALTGCGAVSTRYVVESDMRFEHCYRIDEDSRIPIDTKRACWSEWRERFQRTHDANRIAYATERLRVLEGANGWTTNSPTTTTAATVQGCPNPNSPYAPPPSIATAEIKIGMNAAPPDAACSEHCNQGWKTCSPSCSGEIGCLGDCDGKLRVCMKACFAQ